MVVKDQTDIARVNTAQAKSEYDPYFDRVNHSTDIVLPGTNATTRNR
jgi:hypothetical protein